jgi:hypothetical protein
MSTEPTRDELLARIVARALRIRRRRAQQRAAGLVCMLAAAIAVPTWIGLAGNENESTGVIANQPTTVVPPPSVVSPPSTTTTELPPTTTTTTAPGSPPQAVAVVKGRLALVSTATGRIERYITEELPGGGASDPTLAPDGRTVYFSRGDGTCVAHLAAVSLDGGPERIVASRDNAVNAGPSISSDGRWLSYRQSLCDLQAGAPGRDSDVILDLVTRQERRIETDAESGIAAQRALNSDGSRLLTMSLGFFSVREVRTGKILLVVDDTNYCLRSPIWIDDAAIAMIDACTPGTVALVRIDPTTGQRLASTRLPQANSFSAIVFDRSGRHLLLGVLDESSGQSTYFLIEGDQSRRLGVFDGMTW